MTAPFVPLLMGSASRTTFEWARIHSNTDWIAPVAAFLLILAFVWQMYRRDSVELGWAWRWLLTALRLAAFLGLLVLDLQPHCARSGNKCETRGR